VALVGLFGALAQWRASLRAAKKARSLAGLSLEQFLSGLDRDEQARVRAEGELSILADVTTTAYALDPKVRERVDSALDDAVSALEGQRPPA
jgi:hypothetical protein